MTFDQVLDQPIQILKLMEASAAAIERERQALQASLVCSAISAVLGGGSANAKFSQVLEQMTNREEKT